MSSRQALPLEPAAKEAAAVYVLLETLATREPFVSETRRGEPLMRAFDESAEARAAIKDIGDIFTRLGLKGVPSNLRPSVVLASGFPPVEVPKITQCLELIQTGLSQYGYVPYF